MNTWNQFIELLAKAGQPREWISCLVWLAVGGFISWLITKQVTRLLRERIFKASALGDKIIHALSGPLVIVIFGYFFLLAFDQFEKMPKSLWQRVHDFYPVFNLCALFLLALRAVDIGVEVFRRNVANAEGSLDESWAKLIGVFGRILISAIGLFMILENMGIKTLPLLTGAGFLGAAFALASQSTIGNAIGSFEIMMDRLFKEGDHISFGEYNGFVSKMGLRSIEITALSGEKINLPNKDLVDKQIRNYTRKGRNCMILTVGLTYDTRRPQLERAMELLREICTQHPRVEQPSVHFKSLNAYSLDLQLTCWANYQNISEYCAILSDLNLAIKERFDAEGLSFAFPTQTLHVVPEKTA